MILHCVDNTEQAKECGDISASPLQLILEHIASICNVLLCIFSFPLTFVFVEKTKVHDDMEKLYKCTFEQEIKVYSYSWWHLLEFSEDFSPRDNKPTK